MDEYLTGLSPIQQCSQHWGMRVVLHKMCLNYGNRIQQAHTLDSSNTYVFISIRHVDLPKNICTQVSFAESCSSL
jgi:hypothetical protein